MNHTDDGGRQDSVEKPSTPPRPVTLTSNELFQGNREVLIEHNGEVYRLRITRTGKLILNK